MVFFLMNFKLFCANCCIIKVKVYDYNLYFKWNVNNFVQMYILYVVGLRVVYSKSVWQWCHSLSYDSFVLISNELNATSFENWTSCMLTKQHNTFPSPSIQNKSYDSICAFMSIWFVLNHMLQNSFFVVMDKNLVTYFF